MEKKYFYLYLWSHSPLRSVCKKTKQENKGKNNNSNSGLLCIRFVPFHSIPLPPPKKKNNPHFFAEEVCGSREKKMGACGSPPPHTNALPSPVAPTPPPLSMSYAIQTEAFSPPPPPSFLWISDSWQIKEKKHKVNTHHPPIPVPSFFQRARDLCAFSLRSDHPTHRPAPHPSPPTTLPGEAVSCLMAR